jgi:hypothetical protein
MIFALLVSVNHHDRKDSIRPLDFAVVDVTWFATEQRIRHRGGTGGPRFYPPRIGFR